MNGNTSIKMSTEQLTLPLITKKSSVSDIDGAASTDNKN
jgi:hypothetical protein